MRTPAVLYVLSPYHLCMFIMTVVKVFAVNFLQVVTDQCVILTNNQPFPLSPVFGSLSDV